MNDKPAMSRNALRAALVLAAITIFLVVLVITTAKAVAAPAPMPLDGLFHQIVAADHHVGYRHLRVTDAEGYVKRSAALTLNDGSVWVAPPCKVEDSRNCYWDATRRGNHKGRSLLNLHGHIVFFTR